VIPPALPDAWRPGGVELIEDRELSAAELDQLDGALTGCATAIAQTGTIVLDGHGVCGRRALTLVPDHHVCVVTEDQVVGLVPGAITRLRPAVAEHRRPLTFISGPSATSDIELTRVEGVHGPRNLLVLIAAQ
jgi:L-lactate dehydrogenase complex protein LldG